MPYAVLTRDAEGAGPYAEALAALGLEAVPMPVTRSEPPADPGALLRAFEAGGYAAIVCASARGAGAVIGAKGHAPLPEIWCVGPATAHAFEAAGIAAIVPDKARDGAALARALVAARQLAGKRVLVPRAEDGRNDAIAILRDAGITVDDVVAYRTVAVAEDDPEVARGKELLMTGRAEIVVFFAPSQVTALDAIVRVRLLDCELVAIGETTATALRDAGAEDVVVASEPTHAGIAKAVASVYPPRT